MDELFGFERERWTRREVIKAGGALAAVAGFTACGGSSAPSAKPTGGAKFWQPKELVSANGVLELTLRCEAAKVPHGSGTRFAYTYNGSSPGPTLRVRGGDRVVITLENGLDQPTNLHTHGLHVSPSGASDNVFVQVDPGQSHVYSYEIPNDHRSSVCWYHPHHHGMVAPQVTGGLFGAIIVEDAVDRFPEFANSTQRLLMLSDPNIGTSKSVTEASMMEIMQGREGTKALINGVDTPTIAAVAGTIELWRIVNASPSRYYRLALDTAQMHVVGTDGGRLDRPRSVDDVLLAPGERIEVMIAPQRPGSVALRTLGYDRGSTGMGGNAMMGGGRIRSSDPQILATMRVTGTVAPASLPRTIVEKNSLDALDAQKERTFELAMGMGGMRGGMGHGGAMMAFTINGQTYDASRTDTEVALGSTEDWLLINSSTMDHPFHLHAWPFRVVERSAGPEDLPGWKDTVNVPAGGSVRIRIPFTEIKGRTVYHCHILDHEDQGMMGIIAVA